MAYAEKYHLEFTDQLGDVIRCNIYLNGWGGSSTEIRGSGEPLVFSYPTVDLYAPIRSAEVTLSIISETDQAYSEFFTAADNDYYLELKKNGFVFWVGMYITESFTEPYINVPYNVTLRFSDLGYLKAVDFDDTGLTKVESFLTVMNSALSPLPYSLDLRDVCNVFPDEISETANDSFLSTVLCYPDSFKFKEEHTETTPNIKSIEVIERICKSHGCVFMQSAGEWWFIRIEEYNQASPTYVQFDAGAETVKATGTVSIRRNITNDGNNITWLNQDGEVEITDVYNTITYQFPKDQKTLPSGELILDSDLTSYVSATAQADKLKLWEINGTGVVAGDDVSKGILGTSGELGDYDTPIMYYNEDMLATTQDTTKYIKPLRYVGETITQEQYFQTDSTFLIGLTYGFALANLSYNPNELQLIYSMTIPIRLKVGSKYLTSTAGVLSWGNTDTWVNLTHDIVLGDQDYFNTQTGIDYHFFHPREHKIETPVYVADGVQQVEFSIGQAVSSHLAQGDIYPASLWFTKVSVQHKIDGENQFFGYQTSYDGITTKKDKQLFIETSFGDPAAVYTKTLQGMLWTGPTPLVATTSWHTRGNAEALPHSKIFILEPYSKLYAQYRRRITGTLYGGDDFAFYNSLVLKEDSAVMHIVGADYSVKSGDKKVVMEEVVLGSPSPTTIDSSIPDNDSVGIVHVKGGAAIDGIDTHVSIKGLILPGGGFVNSDVAISNESGFVKKINDSKGHVTHYIKTP